MLDVLDAQNSRYSVQTRLETARFSQLFAQYQTLAATNLALPMSQWSRAATNKFDLAGNYAITNSLPPNLPQQFYRIGLP